MVPLAVDLATITALLAALGVGSILTKLSEGIVAHLRGSHDRETKRVQGLIDARDRAEAERDEADRRRRAIAEHAHRLRLQLISAGLEPETCPTRQED